MNNFNPEFTLESDLADKCEVEITFEEATSALNDMKLNKSPGLDGLTDQFYKAFWDSIGHLVVLHKSDTFIRYTYRTIKHKLK